MTSFITPTATRKVFYSVLSQLEEDVKDYVKKPTDMTRHRKCSFTDTILTTLCFGMNRTNTELFNFFMPIANKIPSKSALTQQRKKFKENLFPSILSKFNDAAPFNKTFKGYHLIAIDGSDLNLPTNKDDTIYRVKQARSDNYYYQMHINALFDICENRYHSLLIQPRPKMNEHQAFMELVTTGNFSANTIFIADRGYCSLNSIANLINQNKFFLIRGKSTDTNVSFLKGVMTPNVEADRFITMAITRRKKNVKNISCDVIKCIRKGRNFDLIEPKDSDSIVQLKIRCTCVKLSDGSYEYLISNLPIDTFSASDLKKLYWKRWNIETSFRSLKYALSLSYLHSTNRDLIIQEVYAKVILYNFTALIHAYAQKCHELQESKTTNKHKYNVSFDDAVPLAKALLKKKMTNGIIKTLLLKHLTAVRVGHESARHVRSQTVKSLNNRA